MTKIYPAPEEMNGADAWSATYIGSATLLLEGAGVRLLTDPVLDACGTEWHLSQYVKHPAYRYTSTLSPGGSDAQLGSIDLVLLSHDQHRDNLDRAGLALAERAATVLTTVAGARRLKKKGLRNVIGLAPGEHFELACDGGLLTVTATEAHHGRTGTNWLAGEVIGFVLSHATLGRAYITGDTVWFDDLADIRQHGPIDYMFVHLGAARFGRSWLRRLMRWSMDADEAVRLTRQLDAAQVMPIHFEGWSHYTEGRDEISARFAAAGLAERLNWLPRGGRVALSGLPSSQIEPYRR